MFGALLAVAAVFTGCATNGGADEPRPLADSPAALGTPETDWNRSVLDRLIREVKGDKPQAEADSQPAAVARSGATGVGANASTTPGPMPIAPTSEGGSLRPKVGVYIDDGGQNSLTAYQFVNALEHKAAANGVSIVKPDSLAEAINVPGVCSSSSPAECTQSLAIYPGIRSLLIVTPESTGRGQMTVSTRMVDTDFGIDYDAIETTLDLDSAGSVQDTALDVWSDRVLGLVQDRISIAPWFTHTFALDGDDMYVSAGRDSGLVTGMVLSVRDAGSVVRAPGGRAVAWRPGVAVGEVRIKQLVGSHLALAEQVSGKMPVPRDKLTVSQ
ncbi:hypothetical protein [Salinisphaera aquimarina]|uniref:Lipoprotein n=1 Tax=Salinisphaera aquimarina TaxID=2094031 RepID=A0ABV7ET81_9GAMM